MTALDETVAAVEPFDIPDPASTLTPMQEYLFDLNGYLVLKGAISADDVAEMNATYDAIAAANIEGAGWFGRVGVNNVGRQEGMIFDSSTKRGPVWEKLVDHPAWFNKVAHFVGSDDPENFDNHHGLLFIDECFGTIRRKGGAQRMHSGGHVGTIRTQYRYHAGKFHCGQIVILMALTDIGPGDGATMVVPGSHKSNIKHPQTVPLEMRGEDISIDGVAGAIECHMKKGDALLFVDAIAHGSARRTNSGGRAPRGELPLRTELGILPLPVPAERGAARPSDPAASPDHPAARRSRRSARAASVLTNGRGFGPDPADQPGPRPRRVSPGPSTLLPPSMATVAPVIITAMSEQRKRISAATSPGSIKRPQAAARGAFCR